MADAPADLAQVLQKSLQGAFSTSGSPYEKVSALVLYWAEDDFETSCAEEAQKVVELFQTDLNYDVQIFPIPITNSWNLLLQAVVNFMCFNDSHSSLLIIYYSGHADPDEKRGKAVWAAKNSGPPTLDWFKIQPTLLNAQGDLLFIFDCCHASLASKGRDQGRLELLAAAGAGARTPSPGEFSFTSHFVVELRRGLQTKGGLRVAELHQLISQHAEQTPVCHNLRSDPKSSILLRRLGGKQRSSDEAKMVQDALGAFTFTVSIVEPPNERIVREFGDWLKTSAPKWISAVKVDEVIDLSNGLKDFILEHNVAGVKGRFLDGLERQDQALVMSEIHIINKIITNSRMASMYPPSTHTISGSMSLAETDNLAMSAFHAVERRVNKFSRTIWSLLSNHRGYQKQSDLESLTSNATARRAGLVPAAKLSLVALEMTPLEAPEIIQGISVSFNQLDTADEYALARYNSMHIIIETQANRSSSSTQSIDENGPPPRISRTCSLLSQPIPEQFRILHCVGYVTSGQRPGGIAYEMPLGKERYSSLREQFRKTSRVPLEVRYRLAHSIAITLQGLHAVRWVHKGIHAKNIFFFRNKAKLAYSFDEPWLLGHSHARENAVASSMQADFRLESLIYLPKSRWGVPSEVFAYHHDIYAFAVLLLEIGLWSRALDLEKKAFKNAERSEQVNAILVTLAEQNLAHTMGTKYADIVMDCLKSCNEVGEKKAQTQMNFVRSVTCVLEELVAHG